MAKISAILFVAIILLAFGAYAQQQSRGIRIVHTPQGDIVPLYDKSWMVVIGIDQYQHWPPLHHAVKDAKGIRASLISSYGYTPSEIIELYDEGATRENILKILGDDLPARIGQNDQVLIFFAGHGQTRQIGGVDQGFIIPVDADLHNYAATAISTIELKEKVADVIPAKHIYFVMDACYSGTIFTRAYLPSFPTNRYLFEITSRVAKQALTAGSKDEQVADGGYKGHSIFTGHFIRGLESGDADFNRDGVITASELAVYIAPRVSNESRQTPQYGYLPGSEGGEFVFVKIEADPVEELKVELLKVKSRVETYESAMKDVRVKMESLENTQKVLTKIVKNLVDASQSPKSIPIKEPSLRSERIDAFWHSMLVPGWGQIRCSRKTEGTIFALTELAAIGSAAFFHYHYESRKDDYWSLKDSYANSQNPAEQMALTNQLENQSRRIKDARLHRKYSIYAAIASYGLNMVDALLFSSPPLQGKQSKIGIEGKVSLSTCIADKIPMLVLNVAM